MKVDMEKQYGIIHEDYVDSSINLSEMNESDQHRFEKMYKRNNKCKNPDKGKREGCCSDGQCTCYI